VVIVPRDCFQSEFDILCHDFTDIALRKSCLFCDFLPLECVCQEKNTANINEKIQHKPELPNAQIESKVAS
jgi:hypothetical protein